jgi:hypothetical protein|nr:MAG TPA: hypothetical protein [Caudoviricetes sp.]
MKAKVKDTCEIVDKDCPWRADLWGKYYYFDEFLKVKFTWEKNIEVDDIRWSVGNYFETADEAEKAVNEAKKVLRTYYERNK